MTNYKTFSEEWLNSLEERIRNRPWYKKLWYFMRRHARPKAKFNQVRWHYKNKIGRMKKGYGPMDLWSLDSHIARVISEGCYELAKTTHGWPQCDEIPTFEDWQAVLREIGDGFAICYKHWDYPHNTWPNGDWMQDPKVIRAWDLLREYFGALWD